ncbi:DUF2786 domain-containing protein [Pseudomonas aeruginosa]|nr:DUF2786 domain-containing protein [Pseudomonas aeruginosa]
MDQDRILGKIKKCLEMAKGRGSNPNEAEIALRHAHKLMEAYNLEMGAVLASMAGEARVPAGSDGKPPAWRVRLAQVCCYAFGTHLIICTSYFKSASFLFVGCAAAPELTGYAYQVLERQLQKARKDYLSTQKRCKRSTKVVRGDAFAHGWIEPVYAKVDQFAGVDDNIADAIQAYMAKHHADVGKFEMKRRKLKARDEVASEAGYAAGRRARLHQGIGHQAVARLTQGV